MGVLIGAGHLGHICCRLLFQPVFFICHGLSWALFAEGELLYQQRPLQGPFLWFLRPLAFGIRMHSAQAQLQQSSSCLFHVFLKPPLHFLKLSLFDGLLLACHRQKRRIVTFFAGAGRLQVFSGLLQRLLTSQLEVLLDCLQPEVQSLHCKTLLA